MGQVFYLRLFQSRQFLFLQEISRQTDKIIGQPRLMKSGWALSNLKRILGDIGTFMAFPADMGIAACCLRD
ncbi:MAG: hypothetical protein M1438_05920 [Deltaproteobacteria bacterium]|nr:hypothetical protein [Deltaproteobacteria bacterium]